MEYEVIHHRHPGWAAVFFLAGWSVWWPAAQQSQTLGHEIIAYIMVGLHFVIAARLACVRPWFTWE